MRRIVTAVGINIGIGETIIEKPISAALFILPQFGRVTSRGIVAGIIETGGETDTHIFESIDLSLFRKDIFIHHKGGTIFKATAKPDGIAVFIEQSFGNSRQGGTAMKAIGEIFDIYTGGEQVCRYALQIRTTGKTARISGIIGTEILNASIVGKQIFRDGGQAFAILETAVKFKGSGTTGKEIRLYIIQF